MYKTQDYKSTISSVRNSLTLLNE